jgi:hypothetical protein
MPLAECASYLPGECCSKAPFNALREWLRLYFTLRSLLRRPLYSKPARGTWQSHVLTRQHVPGARVRREGCGVDVGAWKRSGDARQT